ncbi:hypothetical protein [Pseudaminobacter sp. NGMCC 1.201702]|uniref:hypothetical protein n=1 Tax=Pseudaminobacter sp. NGMCC 1.201702 TaxID=3391825 RepID=UPI0039F089BE
MADFVAVLKKTLDALGDAPPPELRQRVYTKARATVETKLAAITPAPPKAVVERQKRALEDAIATIEKEYVDRAGPKISEDPLQELDDVFASIERQKNEPSKPAPEVAAAPYPTVAPVPPTALVRPAASAPVDEAPAASKAVEPAPKSESWPKTTPVVTPADKDIDSPGSWSEAGNDFRAEDDDSQFSTRVGAVEDEAPAKRRSYGGLIAALIALAVIAGGGYGIWLNKDAFANLFGTSEPEVAVTTPAEEPAPPTEEPAPEADEAATTPATPEAAEPAEPKFTQRLTPEGQEIDAGPAGGTAAIGEGTSLAAATQPPSTATPAAPAETAATSSEQPGVPVGQRAIFYEERTNVAQGSAESGNIVWSVVQESPGGDLPPEPAIRAEATIPGKDLQLRMTIRRNADQTLPASHIIEVIFLTPDGFEGGGIENILRVSMKDSEQAAGSPLIGIPAKIADGFFLVALNDGKAEIESNLTLLRRQSWIDVPLIYKSGRRALFTMEKGIPGQRAFDEALKAWQSASSDGGNG